MIAPDLTNVIVEVNKIEQYTFSIANLLTTILKTLLHWGTKYSLFIRFDAIFYFFIEQAYHAA